MAGMSTQAVAFDFSVNCGMSLYNFALIDEISLIEPRAKDLILLVRRFAKDRGICHAPKGHLPPYAWTLLVVYYLQVGVEDGPLLPPLQGFKMVQGLIVRRGTSTTRKELQFPVSDLSVSSLFYGFVNFYSMDSFDWHKEAISIRRAQRLSPALALERCHIAYEDGSSGFGPSIEDPFEPKRNVGASITAVGFSRLNEEFCRTRVLISEGASLSEILEPWVPPERPQDEEEGSDADATFVSGPTDMPQRRLRSMSDMEIDTKGHTKPKYQAPHRNPVHCEGHSQRHTTSPTSEPTLEHKLGKAILDQLRATNNGGLLEVEMLLAPRGLNNDDAMQRTIKQAMRDA